MATLYNNSESSYLDQSVSLHLQTMDQETVIFFRSDQQLRCSQTCSVAYKADSETGLWLARSYQGEAIMLEESEIAEALAVIRKSSHLIAEVPTVPSYQYDFNVAGLVWPPKDASPPA